MSDTPPFVAAMNIIGPGGEHVYVGDPVPADWPPALLEEWASAGAVVVPPPEDP